MSEIPMWDAPPPLTIFSVIILKEKGERVGFWVIATQKVEKREIKRANLPPGLS